MSQALCAEADCDFIIGMEWAMTASVFMWDEVVTQALYYQPQRIRTHTAHIYTLPLRLVVTMKCARQSSDM